MPHENPFSTRFVRPGTMPYHLAPGHDLNRLASRFETIGRTAQIVGPHGSGKSTLLADLVHLWEEHGERVVVIELHDGQRQLPIRLTELHGEEPPTLIAVDGYEQLCPRAQRELRRFSRRHRIGVVVTAHRSMGIPDLVRCAPSLALVHRIVRDLLSDQADCIGSDAIRLAFDRHEGNVREVLFEMYDLCESDS